MRLKVLDQDDGRPLPPQLEAELRRCEEDFLSRKRQEAKTRQTISDDGSRLFILDRCKDPVPRNLFNALRQAEQRAVNPPEQPQKPSVSPSVSETSKTPPKEASHPADANTCQEICAKETPSTGLDVERSSGSTIESAVPHKRSRAVLERKVGSRDPPRTCLEWLTGERGKKKAKVEKPPSFLGPQAEEPKVRGKESESVLPPKPKADSGELIDGKDPYLKRQWPVELRRRVYVEQMPKPKVVKMGKVLLLWVRQESSRFRCSFTMAFVLWLHERLKMPVVAVVLLQPDYASIVCSSTDSRRTRLLQDVPGMVELRQALEKASIPLFGLYAVEKDAPSLFAQLTRKCQIHAMVASDQLVFGSKKFLKALTKSIPCPLFFVDDVAIVPTRYLPSKILAEDEHKKNFKDAVEALSTFDLSYVKAQEDIQATVNLEFSGLLPPRWKQVDFKELEDLFTKEAGDTGCITRLPLTEAEAYHVLTSYCKYHLEDMSAKAENCHLFAEIMNYIVTGKLSPLEVIKHLKGLNVHEAESVIVDTIFDRERRIYISYRRIRDAMAAGKEGFVELSKFFKQGGEGEAIPLWAYVLPERVYSELNAAFEDEHNTDSQKTVHLPGDIERGQTCDPFFNAIQENLVNRGTMIKHVMGYWVQQIVAEFTDNALQGLHVAVQLLREYFPGSLNVCDSICHVLLQGFSTFSENQKHPVLGQIALQTVSDEDQQEVIRAQERRLSNEPAAKE